MLLQKNIAIARKIFYKPISLQITFLEKSLSEKSNKNQLMPTIF
jgi:hypothetical protein